MGSSFNAQILVDKLAKLNNTQTSIETLSHWCIFHMNKAKQVVETWDRQFHCAPREQRLAFLYLANDILQNSRRKGAEFVAEFWKVLPDALRDVIESGDEFGRNAALRLIGIWEERKVFGSRGQILKDEFAGKHIDNGNKNGKNLGLKLKQLAGSTLDKIVSGYQILYGGQMDEDALFSKCRNAIGLLEKVDKELGGDTNPGQFHGSAVEEMQGQHAVLRNCIEQLTSIESSRENLVSHLREALQEQESKLKQVRGQLQVAQSQAGHVGDVYQQLLNRNQQLPVEKNSKESHTSMTQSYVPREREQSAPVMFVRQAPFPEKSGHVVEDPHKSAAAAMAAKLTASSSSAQMLSYVLSSLASEVVNGNPIKESSGDYPSEKRPKLDNDTHNVQQQNPQQPSYRPFPYGESLQHNVTAVSQQYTPSDPPPPPSSPPPLPPPPPMATYPAAQYIPPTGSTNGASYGYRVAEQQQATLPGYQTVAAPMAGVSAYTTQAANSYQTFQGPEGSYYTPPSSMPMAPIARD